MTAAAELPDRLEDGEISALLERARTTRLEKQWRVYPARNPIASDLHPCLRYQVLRIVAWQVKPPPDPEGLATIEQGRVMEPRIIRQLEDELEAHGIEVVEQQAPFELKQRVPAPDGPEVMIVRGNVDAVLRYRRDRIPVEIKDTGEYVLDANDTEEDLKVSPWTNKWRRQAMIYAYARSVERTLLLLSYRGRRKPIWVHLDYAELEQVLQLCTRATALLRELTDVDHETADQALTALDVPYYPDQVDAETPEPGLRAAAKQQAAAECKRCPWFERACHPPQPAPPAIVIREDLAAAVARYVEVKPIGAEAERLRKALKKAIEGVPEVVAGDHVLRGKWDSREMPMQLARVDDFWRWNVFKGGEKVA